MQNDFDRWNEIKKTLDASDDKRMFFPKTREVWMCSVGRNIGFEQNGSGNNFSRPVLVVKKFNNQMFWTAPLSTKQKKFDFYFNFTDPNDQKVAVIIAQLRLVSIKRFNRKMYEIGESDFNKIQALLKGFLG
jgi:hypothetical protein